jgi:hypothetical protein
MAFSAHTPRQTPRKRRDRRRTNLALLLLVPSAVLTGLWANTIGTDTFLHPSVFHGVIALAILLLSPWKSAIVRKGLGRRRRSSWISLALLALVLTSLVTGLMHALGYTGRIGPLTLMQVHIGAAVGALVLVFLHYRSHPVRPRKIDAGRRSFVRLVSLAAGSGALWLASEGTLDALELKGGERRFTGSHERASFRPDQLPVTSWLDDPVQHLDAAEWMLDVGGRSLTLAEIEEFPMDTFDAVLDCTSAWFSNQRWAGVRIDRIIEPGEARSLFVKSQTGYGIRYPVSDIDQMWLVTRLGDEPLNAGHGYPARIVAPNRRGFWWVKWVVSIERSPVPWWLQLPFPAT